VIVQNRLEMIEVVEDEPGKPGFVVGKNDKMVAAAPSDAVLFLNGMNSWQVAGELLIAASHAIERFKKAITWAGPGAARATRGACARGSCRTGQA
jgi:hypothetical protein